MCCQSEPAKGSNRWRSHLVRGHHCGRRHTSPSSKSQKRGECERREGEGGERQKNTFGLVGTGEGKEVGRRCVCLALVAPTSNFGLGRRRDYYAPNIHFSRHSMGTGRG